MADVKVIRRVVEKGRGIGSPGTLAQILKVRILFRVLLRPHEEKVLQKVGQSREMILRG